MKNVIGILAFTIVASVCTEDALALPQFKKAFETKYVKTHKNSKEYQSVVRKAGCYVCHIKGGPKDKSVQNEYGTLLNKLIEGNAKKRMAEAKDKGGDEARKKELETIMEELEKAFAKAADTKSDEGKGPTFGELIKEAQLPVDVEKATEKYKADLKEAEKKDGGAVAQD